MMVSKASEPQIREVMLKVLRVENAYGETSRWLAGQREWKSNLALGARWHPLAQLIRGDIVIRQEYFTN
jgi:hypothetical protein